MSAEDFLGAHAEGGAISFALGDGLRGAFGGVFGGGIAAATLWAARRADPGRRPISLHTTFLKTLRPGDQRAEIDVAAQGRTATTVTVRLLDPDGDLAAVATVTLAEADALVELRAAPLRSPELDAWDDGWALPLPEGVEAPLMDTLPLRITGMPEGGFAHAVRVPWPEALDVEEAAAMMGDYCGGLAVGAALGPEGTSIPVPNPDLSLRFVGNAWGELIVGVGRLAKIDGGVAATHVEVWTGPDDHWSPGDDRVTLLAVGLSSAVLLAR